MSQRNKNREAAIQTF